ncbi:YesL family protein [Lederbergia lenta]|uniref:Putative membrane enzyme for rhamnogalaturonan degradation n=1 Tax=Lederbergia lenta TaxID=1467 RepID=A0A2X4W2M7_LEDLE|nr:YesL family protein [Lederbergia lenta]MEC2326573.1 YesL family protein [Lederbergia lenta]SQI53152.1 putative membrane enzyme for rhamnogalaturonan degradation [Lederbergia lenta]
METTSGFMEGLYRACDWIMKLTILNILWISFSLLGLILFGIFPATAAMFAVVRKWAMAEMDVSIFQTFWQSYKKEFVKGNLLGAIITICSIVLYIDFHFLQVATNSAIKMLFIPFWIIVFLFICTLFYVFPMFVHYNMKIREVLKNSFFIMVMNPLRTLIMLVSSGGLVFLLTFAPPLMIVCSGNVLALAMMKPAYNAFEKINRHHTN